MRDSQSNVTATVAETIRDTLQIKAAMAGVSLSRYVATLLVEAATDAPVMSSAVISVRPVRDQKGSAVVTIPPDIISHLHLTTGQPIAFAAVPGGALIRPVR